MSVSFGFTEKVVIDGITRSQASTITADKRTTIHTAIANAVTDGLHELAVDVSQVKAVFILSDQDITLETNSGGSPANTLALKANVPYVWFTNKPQALVFTSDITALYITNASGSEANLIMEFLVDPTV